LKVAIKSNNYFGAVSSSATVAKVTLTSKTSSVTASLSKPAQVTLYSIKAESVVTISVKMPDGKTVQVSKTTLAKTGAYKLPPLKFKKTGSYKLLIKVNSTTKTIALTVKK
jgi:hypothetical protein